MNRTVKLMLDIFMGAVVPILILSYLNDQLGTITTYIVAAMVSVSWILIDLFFITRRFNFITSYVGAFAIGRGLLTFWFVDGLQYAFKDSLITLLTVLVFGSSIALGRPIMYYFIWQGINPTSPKQARALKALLQESRVYRALKKGTQAVLIVYLFTGAVNFVLNAQIVVADFGTAAFNQQVAQVDAITRITLSIPEFIVFLVTVVSVRRAMDYYLPEEDENEDESDFWELLQLREAEREALNASSGVSLEGAVMHRDKSHDY